MKLVFDIEANGLNELILDRKGNATPAGTKVWCLVAKDIETEKVYTFTEDNIELGVQLLRKSDLIIGHNIILYDIPMLERTYGKINTPTFDTLVVSKMMYPEKSSHPLGGNSLECWGRHIGVEKTNYTGGFDFFSQEMLDYCIQDVHVNAKIYNRQKEFANKYSKSVWLEHEVTTIIAKQISNGIGFALDKAEALHIDLLLEKCSIEDSLREVFPTKVEERHSEKTGKRLKDRITVFNPGSRKQIAERLQDKYNWIPPQTDKGNPKVDEEVLKRLKFPEVKMLIDYFNITKLMGQVSDWIKRAENSRDGRIHGSINPQGTVTGRMTASQPNLQQVSGDKRARSLFIPRDKWVMVGADASGLEARMLATRMMQYDNGSYANVILTDDIHTVNQKAAGLPSRDLSKTFFYGLIYGAGDAKIGKIINQSAHMGKKLKESYFSKLPAIKKVIDDVKYQVSKKGTVTLLDGREVPCRSEHSALNVQLQGDGAIVMKLAQVLLNRKIAKLNARFMATVHDEWQLECEPSIADTVGQMAVDSIQEAGEKLGCMQLDGEFRVGKDWSETH